MRLSRQEQETVITFNAAEDTANIYSSDPVWARKIQKMKGSRKYSVGYEVDVPKKWIKVTPTRKLSEKQLAVARANMRKINAKRNTHTASGAKKAIKKK